MNSKLVQMGMEAARAAQLQEASDAEWSLSSETYDKADVDLAEGQTLEKESQALYAKAEEDESMATSQEALADTEAAKAANEEEQAVAHFGKAGALETVKDADTEEGVAEAVAASRTEMAARADEVGTTVCDFIPLLGFICDVLGGTAAVGLEATAAAEAAESAALIAAAAEAEVKENAELALAAEMQNSAAMEGELAAGDQVAAAGLEQEAEAETAEAAEYEAAAHEKMDQSALETEAADLETGEAIAEEEESAASFAKSVEYGAAACLDAFFASVVAVVAAVFFTLRIFSLFMPAATEVSRRVITNGFTTIPVKQVSQGFHHCFIFGLTLGYFGTWLSEFGSLPVRARGGIILLFALGAAAVQALLVHALPIVWSMDATSTGRSIVVRNLSFSFLRSLGYLFPLFILEFLILRVCFGQGLFSATVLNTLQLWFLWILFPVTLFVHHWFFERHETAPSEIRMVEVCSEIESAQLPSSSSSSCYGSVNQGSVASSLPSSLESVPLTLSSTQEEPATTAPRHIAILKYFQQYQWPFDVLIASCAFAVLRTCLPSLRRLWPVSKTIIFASHPHWQLFALCGTLILAVGVGVVCLRTSRKREEIMAHESL